MGKGEELQVIVKAKDLAEHTIRITSNCKTFPKKYRFTLVDKMQVKSLNIYESLMEANTLMVGETERRELQTKAITLCDELQFYKIETAAQEDHRNIVPF